MTYKFSRFTYKFVVLCFIVCCYSACGIFKKNTGYGCPTGGANVGAERILAGEKSALRKSRESKFRVKNTINRR